MIERIRLENYGPFREAELRLGRFTVLVGPNASGKTTALRTIPRLCDDFDWLTGATKAKVDQELLLSQRRIGSSSTVVEVETGDQELVVQVTARGAEVQGLPEKLPSHVLLQLQPELLSEASYLDTPTPFLASNGYGLPTALAYLKLNRADLFEEILVQTRAIVPSFESVRFVRARITHNGSGRVQDGQFGDQLVFDLREGGRLDPALVSDGTLLTLGLLTAAKSHAAFQAEKAPLVILIDELERSLHPRALSELVGHLRQIAEEAGVQILATSHSPYLLDALAPEEVRLTGFLDDGTATIRELTDHPDFERWKDEMTPGEFWSLVGEDWIAKVEKG